ncbi:MAG: hypothetical protein MUF06_23145 [Pirellulaceae bacterium]|nr:hypothetical protein [Pirellulaceae bacterium]
MARRDALSAVIGSVRMCLAAALFGGLGALTVARAQEEAKAEIPLKKVVMFSSGVAFYERAGEVEGDKTVDLRFNTRDINDLLKSMVLQDDGGGRISTISYGSKDPITRTLQTFSIDLTSNPTLADLLGQIRGEKIELDGPAAIQGTIVGVEKRQKPVGDTQSVEVAYLNLLTEEGLRSISLDSVGRIKLADPRLDAELRQALAVLASGKSQDKKSVSLNFTGAGKRPVRVGYIQESPIWKTSYRLVLGEDKPLLQGWAIVENTTEEDWENVNLTLISGRPISFVMDLYQPLYVDRPVVQPELFASLRPRTYDQDLASANQEFEKLAAAPPPAPAMAGTTAASGLERQSRGRGMLEGEERRRAADAYGLGVTDFAKQQMDRDALGRTAASVAQASDVGEMFQYQIATPVSLGRQKSAMLPIVNDSVQGEKLSIYNPSVHAKHPLHGLRLKNTTDLHLMQGPVTVFDDGAYAGDAQIQDLPPGSERLISYSMDLDTEVAPTMTSEPEQLVTVKIVRGTLEATRKYGRKQAFVVKNSGKEAKKVLIEHPVVPGWNLIEPKEPTEKTRDLYRFAVAAEPGKPSNLEIREERTDTQYVALTSLDDNLIQFYIKAPEVSDKVKAALAEVVKRKSALAQLAAKRAEIERQVQVIFEEQTRIRQNMERLSNDSDLYRRYVSKFNEQEDQVESLRTAIQQATDAENASRESLNKYLQELDIAA